MSELICSDSLFFQHPLTVTIPQNHLPPESQTVQFLQTSNLHTPSKLVTITSLSQAIPTPELVGRVE